MSSLNVSDIESDKTYIYLWYKYKFLTGILMEQFFFKWNVFFGKGIINGKLLVIKEYQIKHTCIVYRVYVYHAYILPYDLVACNT